METQQYLGIINHQEPWQNASRIGKMNEFQILTLFFDQSENLCICENFAMSRLEYLLSKGYDFVLTSKFQSDTLQRRYGQYRQIIRGKILIGLKDTTLCEKIVKLKVY